MMDKGLHRSKFHHTPDKITLDIWREKALVFNYVLSDMDNRFSVFILVLISITHFEVTSCEDSLPCLKPPIGRQRKYSDSKIFHKISKGYFKEYNLKTAS